VPLRQGTPRDLNDPQIKIAVGRVRWMDILPLRSIRQRFILNQPARHLSSGQPFQAGLKQLVPFMPASDRVFVARAERRPVGYAVFNVLYPDRRWVLEGIGANLGIYESQPVWEELVNYGVVAAGLEGTKRLYARVPCGSDLAPVVRASGFTPYASEFVLGAPLLSLNYASARVRRQQGPDVWSIHQLYMATVPQPVQYAEALTSHRWDINPRFSASSLQAGWIIEDGFQVVAYLRAESRPDSHVLEFLIRPEHGELFPHLLAGALADLAGMAPRQVHILVRGYQQEFIRPLQDRGFSVQLEQDLHVKYTTAMARLPVATVVNFPQEVKEPAGKRVPTFLNGSSGDPASNSSG
jgi:hypothetical protein